MAVVVGRVLGLRFERSRGGRGLKKLNKTRREFCDKVIIELLLKSLKITCEGV